MCKEDTLRIGEAGVSAIEKGMQASLTWGSTAASVRSVNKDSHTVTLEGLNAAGRVGAEVVVHFSTVGSTAEGPLRLKWLQRHNFVRHADCNSVWRVEENGDRSGDVLGVDWQACNASQEWDQPVVMEDKRRQVFLSDAMSNSGKSYSNQVFSFTLSRKKEHCE